MMSHSLIPQRRGSPNSVHDEHMIHLSVHKTLIESCSDHDYNRAVRDYNNAATRMRELNTNNTSQPDALGAAWDAGGDQLMAGVGQFAVAGIVDAKGGQVPGRCILPDGTELREGNHIQLGW